MVLLPRHDRASVEGVTLKDRERLFSTVVDVTLGISQASSPGDHDRAARVHFSDASFSCVCVRACMCVCACVCECACAYVLRVRMCCVLRFASRCSS